MYRFGPFTLDTAAYRLLNGSTEVALTPKAFDLLRHLLERPGTLVSKEELFERVWPDVAVTDNALTQVVSDLRQALGDAAGAPGYVQTVARRGYRFIGSVEDVRAAAPRVTIAAQRAVPRSLVVLDFANVNHASNLAWLSAGIAETVTGYLSGRLHVRVIDRTRVLASPAHHRAPIDVARALGAHLLVTGAFQHADHRLRITARLVDVATGDVRAEAKADGADSRIFELQDAIAQQLVDVSGGAPAPAALRRARHTSNLDAYRAAIEGRLLLESLDAKAVPEAIQRFTTAIQLDPGYAPAHVGLASARCYLYERARHRPDAPADVLAQAIEDARRGVALDDRYAEAHATLSFVLSSAGQREGARHAALRAVAIEPDEWMHQFRLGHATWGTERLDALARALALYPDFPFAHFQRAMVYVARGAAESAVTALEEGLRAEQRHGGARRRFPASGLQWLLGMIALSRGDTEDAIQAFESEIASGRDHLYSEEFELGARLGLGFARLASGGLTDAAASFEPLVASDGSGRALLGLALTCRQLGNQDASSRALGAVSRVTALLRRAGRTEHAHMLDAAAFVAGGDEEKALALLAPAVAGAPAGPFGWTLPIDPVFAPLRDLPEFTRVLATIASRAT
jgi:adenylate cyclase